MRSLRDELRARLDQLEDYRAWKALDDRVSAIRAGLTKRVRACPVRGVSLNMLVTFSGRGKPGQPRPPEVCKGGAEALRFPSGTRADLNLLAEKCELVAGLSSTGQLARDAASRRSA